MKANYEHKAIFFFLNLKYTVIEWNESYSGQLIIVSM